MIREFNVERRKRLEKSFGNMRRMTLEADDITLRYNKDFPGKGTKINFNINFQPKSLFGCKARE